MFDFVRKHTKIMQFLLFLLIFFLTSLQRFVLRDKDDAATRKAQRRQQRAARRKGAKA